MTQYYHDNIPGWMDPKQLDWLASQAAKSPIVVEIGIWRGRSTFAICANCPGVVFSIDSWRPSGSQYDDPDGARREAMKNLEPFIRSGKLIILPYRSLDALEYLAKVLVLRPPDWIFIDGDHDPRVVAQEIDKARYMKCGLISGHDYDEVHAGLPNGVKHGPGSIWYFEPEEK